MSMAWFPNVVSNLSSFSAISVRGNSELSHLLTDEGAGSVLVDMRLKSNAQ